MTIRTASLLLLFCCAGCFRIDLYAPPGANVYLISSDAPVHVHRQWRTWFAAWGLSPIDNTTPDLLITREKLTEVRLITIDTVPDAFLGFLYNILIPIGLTHQSVIIEGNRADTPTTTHPTASSP